jgi:HAMP domain-containing protein
MSINRQKFRIIFFSFNNVHLSKMRRFVLLAILRLKLNSRVINPVALLNSLLDRIEQGMVIGRPVHDHVSR